VRHQLTPVRLDQPLEGGLVARLRRRQVVHRRPTQG
jgi:hypothetical protein